MRDISLRLGKGFLFCCYLTAILITPNRYGKTSGFEVVHGLLDRIMLMLKSAFITREDGLQSQKIEGSRTGSNDPEHTAGEVGYWIEEIDGESLALACSYIMS